MFYKSHTFDTDEEQINVKDHTIPSVHLLAC